MAPHADLSTLLLAEARKLPKFDAEQQRELVTRHRAGDEAAFGQLIITNVRHAINRATKLRGYGLARRRSDPGRDHRPDRGFRAIRHEPRRSVQCLCVVVDQGDHDGICTAQLVHRADVVQFGAEDPVLQGPPAQGEADARSDHQLLHRSERPLRPLSACPVREVELMEARLTGDVHLNAPAHWGEDGEGRDRGQLR